MLEETPPRVAQTVGLTRSTRTENPVETGKDFGKTCKVVAATKLTRLILSQKKKIIVNNLGGFFSFFFNLYY